MKQCSSCGLFNPEDTRLCTSCGNPIPEKNKGYLQIIRWHLLTLLLVLGIMGMLKYRGGELFRDFGHTMSSSTGRGRVEISSVRIYHDRTEKNVVEGNLRNISKADFKNLRLEIIIYNAANEELARHIHLIPTLPKGKVTPFIAKIPFYEKLNYAHFNLRKEDATELYLINLKTDTSPQ